MESKLITGKIKDFRTKIRARISVTEIDVLSENNQTISIILRDNYKMRKGTNVKVKYISYGKNHNLSKSYTNLDVLHL